MAAKNIRWPEPGDKLFTSTPSDRRHNLCFAFYRSLEDRERLRVDGFKLAADCVVLAHEAAPGPPYREEYLFPVAFLYRQYIELKLKQLLRCGQELRLIPRADICGHKLARLWTEARDLLEKRWPDADSSPLDAIEEIVSEFQNIDPDGAGFRYHIARNGTPLLQQLPNRVSLARLKETMDNVYLFFECCSGVLADDLDAIKSHAMNSPGQSC